MAYLKLWIDPSIIPESQIQLPDKVVVGTNEDGSDKHNLVTERDSYYDDRALFLLDPDPKYLQMPIWYAETKDNLSKSYLYVHTDYVNYANYWTRYVASKLRVGIDTDTYGTCLRLGCKNNILASDEINKISTTYNTLEDGTKDYYLLPACAEGNHALGGYYHQPTGSSISSTYIKDNSSNIGKIDHWEIDTGTYTSKYVIADSSGIGCAVLIKDRITFAEGVTKVELPIGNVNNNLSGAFNLHKADGYYYFEIWSRGLGFFNSEPLQDFDITEAHTYVIISNSSPSYTVELWIDGKQYKKEDGTDFTNSYNKYEKLSFSTSTWTDFNTHNIYDFRLIQGEEPGDLNYYDILPLVASITASRNPVVTNVPSLSTSELTCHVEGLPNRKVNITDYFDQGKLCLRWDPDSKEFACYEYDTVGNLYRSNTHSVEGTELDVIDGTIVRSNKGDLSNPWGFGGYVNRGVPNTSSNLSILNLDCKIEYLPGDDNVLFYDDSSRSSAIEISIQLIRDNRYIIKVNDNSRGWKYSAEYTYDPCEWHTYTVCSSCYFGYLYLFIDGNLVLYCSKIGGRVGRFNMYIGNPLEGFSVYGSPTYKNTVYFRNIVEYGFYNKDEIMASILKDYYKYDQYLINDWGELDFSVFPPKLIYADGTEWCDTDQINLNYSHSSNKVTIDNEDCLLVDGAIHVSSLKDNVAYQYPVVYCSNTQSVQIEFKFKVKQDAISSDRHNACLWSQGYYRGGGYNACGYMVELLSNGKWKVTTSNNDLEAKTNNPCSDELDLSFYEWHDIKIIMCQFPGYTTGGHDGYTELYIDGVYIPFRMPDNYTGTDTSRLSGTNVKATPSGSASAIIRNYWHYEFRSYRNWYYNEVIYYKNYKIKTLTLNPDYEEYPELTYLWNTGETTKQITVQPTVPTTYSCTVTQGTRTANASILIDTVLEQSKPIAVISPQEKPYIEHMIGRFYATNSYDINDPVSPIVKYIWNDVETVSPVFVTRVKRTDKIRLKVVNALGLVSDEVEVDLSKDTDQWGNRYKFLDIPMFLICSKGANLFDTLISRFHIPTNTLDLYSNFYPTEYDKYTSIGFTTDISTDTIKYMACLPHHGVAEYTANREQVDIYPLGISWLEKRNMIKYYNKVKGSKGSLMACLGHPEIQEEGYGSLEFVLDALGIITPKERYTIPRLLDLIELLLMDYDNGGLQKL